MRAEDIERRWSRIWRRGWAKQSRRRLRDSVRPAVRSVMQTRSSARTVAASCEGDEDTEKLATTEDTVDTEVFQNIALCPLCPPWWSVSFGADRCSPDGGHPTPRER